MLETPSLGTVGQGSFGQGVGVSGRAVHGAVPHNMVFLLKHQLVTFFRFGYNPPLCFNMKGLADGRKGSAQ